MPTLNVEEGLISFFDVPTKNKLTRPSATCYIDAELIHSTFIL